MQCIESLLVFKMSNDLLNILNFLDVPVFPALVLTNINPKAALQVVIEQPIYFASDTDTIAFCLGPNPKAAFSNPAMHYSVPISDVKF